MAASAGDTIGTITHQCRKRHGKVIEGFNPQRDFSQI